MDNQEQHTSPFALSSQGQVAPIAAPPQPQAPPQNISGDLGPSQPQQQAPQQYVQQSASENVERPYNPPPGENQQFVAPLGSQSQQAYNAPQAPPQTPIYQAAQSAGVVPSIPQNAIPVRSFFDDTPGYADKCEIDGFIFYFDLLSDRARGRIKNGESELASQLGVLVEQMTDKDFRPTTEQREIQERYQNDLWTFVLTDTLRQWTLPRPFTPENIAKLKYHDKGTLMDAIINASIKGVSGARFRQINAQITAIALV